MSFSYQKQLKISIFVLLSIMVYEAEVASWNYNRYIEAIRLYGLVEPWQWAPGTKLIPMENFTHCNCPRVYYPVCAWDNVTYVNGCVMKCLDQKSRREGPCIIYRRSGARVAKIAFPTVWANNSQTNLMIKPVNVDKVIL